MDDTIDKDMIIGEVIEKHPSTIAVFKKFFGDGCYTCPGANNEDIAFGSMMHNVDAGLVLKELNAAIKKGQKGK
ncbi:MAG: DUF1858 domain-containing protein [Deltaproteobacteria bacterium]|nr:DUF1858 domain-containing protein [Deltaproteobacteria bacterium]